MFASPLDDPCLKWRKSSHSGGDNNDCVEVALTEGLVGLRDSKDPQGPRLGIRRRAAHQLIAQIKAVSE